MKTFILASLLLATSFSNASVPSTCREALVERPKSYAGMPRKKSPFGTNLVRAVVGLTALAAASAVDTASAGYSAPVTARSYSTAPARTYAPAPAARVYTPSAPPRSAPAAPMNTGGMATGRLGGQTTTPYGGGQPIGTYGGTIYKSSSPPPLPRTSVPSIQPRSSTRGPEAAAAPVQDRLRANIPRPSQARGVNEGLSSGYLSPSAHDLVFSPIHFYYPFNIWHPRRATVVVNNSYYPPNSSGGDYTPQLYTEGEIGAIAVNEAPEDVQGELRLMHTKQKDPFPEDPTIATLAASNEEWTAHAALIETRFNNLRTQLKVIDDLLGQYRQVEKFRKSVDEANVTLAYDLAQIGSITQEIKQRQDELAAADQSLALAQDDVKTTEHNGFWCRVTGFSWVCNWAAGNEIAARDRVREAQSHLQYQLEQAQDENRAYAHNIDTDTWIKSEREADLANASHSLTGTEAQAEGRKAQLQIELRQAEDEARAYAGFVASPIPNVACENPMLYRSIPGIETTTNPLLGTVEAELTPNPNLSLRVCLDGEHKLSQVHIFEKDNDRLHSKITRDGTGRINEIAILDEKNELQEDHRWSVEDNNRTRYAITFRTGSDPDDLQSIYQDVPAEPLPPPN